MKKRKLGGFSYYLSPERIKDYQSKPIEKRLTWLYLGNLLRKNYPGNIIRIQDKFRQGKI
jgi:hypothetical protein